MPLARLEKNRSRTPLLPEPTAMDMLYEQLKVSLGLCLCQNEKSASSSSSNVRQNVFSIECMIERIDFPDLIIEACLFCATQITQWN